MTFKQLDILCKNILKSLIALSAELTYSACKDPTILVLVEETHKEIDECSDYQQLYQLQQALTHIIKLQQLYYIQQGHTDALNKIMDDWRAKNQAMNDVVVKLLYCRVIS